MRIGFMKNFYAIKKLKKDAFTLAEVLVTLGIIGVVAALTMPTLVSNHKKAVLKSQFKKTYSTISQAYDAAAVSLGYFPQCYYWEQGSEPHHCLEYDAQGECTKYVLNSTGEEIYDGINGPRSRCKPLFDAMVNNLKVVKRCNGNAFADGCIPDYKGIDTMHKANNEGVSDIDTNKATTGCLGYRKNNIKTKSTALVLADGSIYITYGVDDWYKFPLFLIDVNGKKGPNKWGHDLFSLELSGNADKEFYVNPTGNCMPYWEEGGVHPKQMLVD